MRSRRTCATKAMPLQAKSCTSSGEKRAPGAWHVPVAAPAYLYLPGDLEAHFAGPPLALSRLTMTSILKTSTLLATLLLATAACGSVGGMQMDPSDDIPDAGTTVPDPDGPDDPDDLPLVGPCSVTTGVFGLAVDLHAADGSLLESAMTTAGGIAAFDECPRDAMISFVAYEEKLDGWRGVTIPGVQPDSHYQVGLPQVGWQGTLLVEVPDDNASLQSPRLHAGARCVGNTEQGTSKELAITAECLGDSADLLPVIASARIDDAWFYSHSEIDPAFNKNSVTYVAEEDMTNWIAGGSVALTAINSPSPSVSFKVEWMKNGQSYGSASWTANLVDDIASRAIPVPPASFSTTRRVGVSSNGVSRQGYIQLSNQSAVDLDLANSLGAIGEVVLDKTDITRPGFALSGIDTDADVGIIRLRWLTEADQEVIWRVLVPTKDMASIVFPALSDDLAEVRPNETFQLQEMYLIDMTGDEYPGILSSRFRLGSTQMHCGDVTESSMCRFAYANLSD